MANIKEKAGVDNVGDRLARARALLLAGRMVFLENDRPPRWPHARARWPGEYHLARVEESWNAPTNKFAASWHRDGGSQTVEYILKSHTQVKTDVDFAKMTVQVEDEDNGNVHTAKIVDMPESDDDGEKGKVRIKWNHGYEQDVNVSQVFFGYKKRSRVLLHRQPERLPRRRMAPRQKMSRQERPKPCAKQRRRKVPPASAEDGAAAAEKPSLYLGKGETHVGRRVSKVFGGALYHGTVSGFVGEHRLWSIGYDDGDTEEMDWGDLVEAIKLHDKKKETDLLFARKTNGAAGSHANGRRCRKRRVGMDSGSEENPPARRKREGRSKNTPKTARLASSVSSTTTNASPAAASRPGRVRKQIHRENMFSEWSSGASSGEDDGTTKRTGQTASARKRQPAPPSDTEFSGAASEVSEALDVEEDEGAESKPKGRRKAKAMQTKAKEGKDGEKKTSMAENFQPMNAPPYFRESLKSIEENHEPLDPCGIEATDGIIEGLIGKQLDSIGGLLARALRSEDCRLGSAAAPLKIATACSGTDAPVLALTILEEQMDLSRLN